MDTCYIVSSMPCTPDFVAQKGDFVIAADGGYATLRASNMRIDVCVGDMDSLGYCPSDVPVIKMNSEKDYTDTYAAVCLGLEKGYKRFVLYGALGGRLDHTLANLQTLVYLSQNGCRAVLRGDGVDVLALTNGALDLPPAKGTLSVFTVSGEARGVTLKGLKYPLTDYTLLPTYPIGISNERSGAARIEVKDGTLLIFGENLEKKV